jgi:hypothetical protein
MLENLILAQIVKKFLIFMEAEFSLTFSQTPVSARYPEPVLSNSCPLSSVKENYIFRKQCICLLQVRNLHILLHELSVLKE